jgi:hypothetical protein
MGASGAHPSSTAARRILVTWVHQLSGRVAQNLLHQEDEQADGKVTKSGAYLVKLALPFAFPPRLKGYVPVLLYFPLMLTCNHEEEQAAVSISFA